MRTALILTLAAHALAGTFSVTNFGPRAYKGTDASIVSFNLAEGESSDTFDCSFTGDAECAPAFTSSPQKCYGSDTVTWTYTETDAGYTLSIADGDSVGSKTFPQSDGQVNASAGFNQVCYSWTGQSNFVL